MATPLTSRFSEEFNKLVDRVLQIETRLVVFETKGEAWERRLLELHFELNRLGEEIRDAQSEMRTAIESLHGSFRAHVDQENRDRQKLFMGMMTTLATVLLTVLGYVGSRVWDHVTLVP